MRAGLVRAQAAGGRRLNALMWYGLAGGPLAWVAEHVVGWGFTQAGCGAPRWGISLRAWEFGITALAFAVWAGAAAAAVAVFLATRNEEKDAPPPVGRLHMIAAASLAVESVFFCLILLAGISSTVFAGCHAS
jgi:hypothetical protein